MANSRSRTTRRRARYTYEEPGERRTYEEPREAGRDLVTGSLLTGVELMASFADAARTFWLSIVDREQSSRAELGPSTVRRFANTLADATDEAFQAAAEAPQRILRQTRQSSTGTTRRTRGRTLREEAEVTSRTRVTERPRSSISGSEQDILDSAEDYLDGVASSGAVLDSVIDHVALDRDIDRSIVRSVLTRHFVNNGKVIVNKKHVEESSPLDPVVDWFEDELERLGYKDLRRDYELTGFRGLDEEAALIAFVDDDPVVLCYPVSEGGVGDATYREAARFEAGSVAPGKTARYAWLSDGLTSYIYDLEEDRVVPRVPRHVDRSMEVDDLDLGT